MPAFLEAEPAMLEPLAIHRLEGVFVGEPDSSALLLARLVVAEVPSPAPCSRDGQAVASQVREGVCLASCLGLSNG
jgi:hypothetical protein